MDEASVAALLTEIRDLQKTAVENQREAIRMQEVSLAAFARARRFQMGAVAILVSLLALFYGAIYGRWI